MEPLTIDPRRFNSLLAGPVLKTKFASNSIRSVDDVLWYFALSRDQAVSASEDAVASTDTNVLSEVRLSKLVESPQGDDSPTAFLEHHSSMDIGSYLGGKAEGKLSLLGMYFLRGGSVLARRPGDLAGRNIDARLGRTLKHRRAIDMLDFAAATELYYRYPRGRARFIWHRPAL